MYVYTIFCVFRRLEMKKPVNLIYLIGSIAAFAVFAILTLAFGIHYEWLSYGSFWTIWLMAVIPVLASTIVTCCYLNKFKSSETFVSLPLIICSSIFALASYILGAILTAVISSFKGEVTWFMWAVELIIIVVYASFLFYVVYGTNYISKNRKNFRKKVNYIRTMTADLNVVIPTITDDNLKKAVESLRDDIRYSDPMSDGSVAQVEEILYSTVCDIVERINRGIDFETCKVQLQKARLLLAQRNEEIKYSK